MDGSNPNSFFYFINIFLYLSFGSILNSIFTRIGQSLFINGTYQNVIILRSNALGNTRNDTCLVFFSCNNLRASMPYRCMLKKQDVLLSCRQSVFYYFGDRGPAGPAVQNNYVELCAIFLFTLPLVGIYATPVGAKMALEL